MMPRIVADVREALGRSASEGEAAGEASNTSDVAGAEAGDASEGSAAGADPTTDPAPAAAAPAGTAPAKTPRARPPDIGPWLDAAHAGGLDAVRALLHVPVEELRLIARALGRPMGERFRRAKDEDRMREELAAEFVRRATRNDVFLASSEEPPVDG